MIGPEPTDALCEAYLTAHGYAPSWIKTCMDAVRKHRGTSMEPSMWPALRGVIAHLNGVPVTKPKRRARKPF